MSKLNSEFQGLDDRSREIFREIVESYLANGTPVGSRNISRQLPMTLSPASVRNIMSDLESLGLIYSPHTSAGRMPTDIGLRLFVDALLEVGNLNAQEQKIIESELNGAANQEIIESALTEVSDALSGLSHCAGVVLTDKQLNRVRHVEFVRLDDNRALAVIVGEDGSVENRAIELPEGMTPSVLTEASNYLNSRIVGKTFDECQSQISKELNAHQTELDEISAKLVEIGLATWSGGNDESKSLIVRGRSNLLDEIDAEQDLERIRTLFDDMEAKKDLIQLLKLSDEAEGVKIFIGSENQLFSLSGSSTIVAPFKDSERQIVGVLGVIGPTRLNYAKIIPMVDYTAKLVSRMIS